MRKSSSCDALGGRVLNNAVAPRGDLHFLYLGLSFYLFFLREKKRKTEWLCILNLHFLRAGWVSDNSIKLPLEHRALASK